MHDPAAIWLKRAKQADPARFRVVAARHPVLSVYQVDRRRSHEVELREAEEDEAGGYRPGSLDRLIHRDWMEATWQEAA
jgi:hypothetical protein